MWISADIPNPVLYVIMYITLNDEIVLFSSIYSNAAKISTIFVSNSKKDVVKPATGV